MSKDKERPGLAPSVPPTAPPSPAFPGGYAGKILRVNLTNKTIADEALSQQLCRRYIGGAGFVAYFLWKELKAGVDPLGPDNKLIFALGPVTGSTMPGASATALAPSPR